MRVTVVLLFAFAILASGCTREKVNPYEPDVPNNVGAVRVIVQDNDLKRVVNATILIMPGGAYGNTDENGIFIAEDLAPGDATATVNAKGYSDGRQPFVIKAGTVNEVVLHVDRLR